MDAEGDELLSEPEDLDLAAERRRIFANGASVR